MKTKSDSSTNFLGRLLRRPRVRSFILAFGLSLMLPAAVAFAEYCWQYVDLFDANNPKTWTCRNPPPSGAAETDLEEQKIIDEHFNWHCANGHIGAKDHLHPDPDFGPHFGQPGYGRVFLGLHKQMINDFDLFRDARMSLDRIETWDPNPFPPGPNYNPMPWGIPGSGVSDADAGAIAGGECLNGTGRSGNGVDPATFTRCPACQVLYSEFRVPPFGTLGVPGTAGAFATADALGDELDSGWHASFHSGIAAAMDADGNRCNDINPPRTSPRDAMFWRAHSALDDAHSTWQKLQASDLMIVFDRSGSMNQPAEMGSAVSKLNAAKEAAQLFADLVEDGQGHTLGLVSFSTTATDPPDLGLTSVDGISPTIQSILSGISGSGTTAMGDGLLVAQNELTTNGANERKAMLLLTDGKENEPPCLEGTGFGCPGTGSGVAANAFGDTQICAIGYGDETSLDGDVLRNLTERQAGIYTSGVGTLQLKKFFVDCFADIFDEFTGTDPIDTLPGDQEASDPIVVASGFDTKLTFVLAWEPPPIIIIGQSHDVLRLSITTPSGEVVDLSDPSIESSAGPTWHFVRIPLPYRGEAQGNWQAQAVRVDPPGSDVGFFINALASGAARLEPTNLRFHHYTGESLYPVIRIKTPYRPPDEFDAVDAEVTITRPLVGTGNLLAKQGLGEPTEFFGDHVDARTAKLQELAQGAEGELIPTVTETFPLYDDGTNGDRFANNHYWSAKFTDLARVEGHYQYHFVFTITEDGQTFRREANQSVYVEVKIDPEATEVEVESLGAGPDGRERSRFTFTPKDNLGNLLGPGRADAFELALLGDAQFEGEITEDGHGKYIIIVSWTEDNGEPKLVLTQNGRTRQTLILPTGEVIRGAPDPATHFDEHPDPPTVPPEQASVQREVSNLFPAPGESVTVTIIPSGFETYNYAVDENIGDLVYTGSHTADGNPEETTFTMSKPLPFSYTVQIPDSAKPGDKFIIKGEFWNDPAGKANEKSIGQTVLKVQPTAVDLINFTGTGQDAKVVLNWQTASELDNEGFNLWRSETQDGVYEKINETLIPAQGNPDTGASYTYVDSNVVKGRSYFYKLQDIDLHGVSTFHGPIAVTASRQWRIYLPLLLVGMVLSGLAMRQRKK